MEKKESNFTVDVEYGNVHGRDFVSYSAWDNSGDGSYHLDTWFEDLETGEELDTSDIVKAVMSGFKGKITKGFDSMDALDVYFENNNHLKDGTHADFLQTKTPKL